MPRQPPKDELTLLGIRQAFRSSEAISALIAAALLWPLVGLVAPVMVMLTAGALRDGNLRGGWYGFLMLVTIIVVTLALWRSLDWFFNSAGCLVSLVSLLLSLFFGYLFALSYAKLLILSVSNKSELGVTLSVALSLATFAFFWRHAMSVGFLKREERAIITQRWPGQPVVQHFFGSLSGWRQATRRSRSDIAATALRVIAKMIQGLSIYVLVFLFGVVLFHVTMLWFVIFNLFYDRSRIGSFEGFSAMSGYVAAFFGMTLTAVFLLTQAAMALKRGARWLSRYSFEQAVATDRRPPILFLRSFADDQVTLPTPPFHVTYWLAEPRPRRLDHILVERFSNTAPVVAIGKPGEKNLPFGAARLYIADEEWKDVVKGIAARSHGVVVIADDSPGVDWEIRCMLEEPFIGKSIFLASPRSGASGLEAHPVLGPALASASVTLADGHRVLAAFREGGRWRLLTVKKPAADDYLVCCQAFLRRHSGAEAGVLSAAQL